ncbi:MAG TPA: hypothetical protein VN800_00050 [Candidatus Acidoferrales bacterium]|nr:hypothetical protein [Candidatus Acidoferrales bacterium]
MSTPAVPEFRLRFPVGDVPRWAAAYPSIDDLEIEAVGRRARMRGRYTRDEFLAAVRWKAPRRESRCARNSEALIEEATATALRASDERLRVGVLTLLDGVEMPTASVLLHLAHPDPYPVLDAGALWSVGVDTPPASYSFAFWQAYTRACRSLARQAGVSIRLLDRALRQHATECQQGKRSAAR